MFCIVLGHADSFSFTIVVVFGEENAVTVGPWTVFAEVVSGADDEDAENLLKQKAMNSMSDIFDGHISYYVETRVMMEKDEVLLPWPLVFISEFTRETRPRAWKQTDLKVQSTLPLLGADETSKELTDGERRVLARVSLMVRKRKEVNMRLAS